MSGLQSISEYLSTKNDKKGVTASHLRKFILWYTKKPEITKEEADKASLDLLSKTHEEQYNIYYEYVKYIKSSSYLPGTQHQIVIPVRLWFRRNRIVFDDIENDEIKRLLPRNISITEDESLTIDKISAILSNCDSLMKALLLILCSSGARIGEVLQIKRDGILYDSETDTYFFKMRYDQTKTGKPHKYFISHEAFSAVQHYLKNYEMYLEKAAIKTEKCIKQNRNNSDNLFPVSVDVIRYKLKIATKKAKLLRFDESSNRATIHLHSFRKFADTVFKEHLGINMGNELIGHDEGLSSSYRRYDSAAVAAAYRKVEPFVTILAPKDYVEIKTKVIDEVERMNGVMANQSIKIDDLERIIELMDVKIQLLKSSLNKK